MSFTAPEIGSLEYFESLMWGTRGKDGTEPLRLVRLGECTSSHLENIARHLLDRPRVTEEDQYVRACRAILESRKYIHNLPEELFEI